MASGKKKKRLTFRKAKVVEMLTPDPLDDNNREQVKAYQERPEEMLDENWARPGDEDKPEAELPQVTNVKAKVKE